VCIVGRDCSGVYRILPASRLDFAGMKAQLVWRLLAGVLPALSAAAHAAHAGAYPWLCSMTTSLPRFRASMKTRAQQLNVPDPVRRTRRTDIGRTG